MPPKNPKRNELHVMQYPAGHLFSTDCFCEPSKIHWEKNEQGERVLVVEHRDDCPHHHNTVLHARKEQKDWITELLDSVEYHP